MAHRAKYPIVIIANLSDTILRLVEGLAITPKSHISRRTEKFSAIQYFLLRLSIVPPRGGIFVSSSECTSQVEGITQGILA